MSKLDDFREMIDGIKDQKVLESGQVLLREIIEINKIKNRLSEIESGLTDGGKAIFYFFAEELDEDEILYAAERVNGRIQRIQREADISKAKDANNNSSSEAVEQEDEESNSI